MGRRDSDSPVWQVLGAQTLPRSETVSSSLCPLNRAEVCATPSCLWRGRPLWRRQLGSSRCMSWGSLWFRQQPGLGDSLTKSAPFLRWGQRALQQLAPKRSLCLQPWPSPGLSAGSHGLLILLPSSSPAPGSPLNARGSQGIGTVVSTGRLQPSQSASKWAPEKPLGSLWSPLS